MKIEPAFIGQKFAKPFWTTCYFVVHDVGLYTAWGLIIDERSGRIVDHGVFPLTDEWIVYDDAASAVINRLAVREE